MSGNDLILLSESGKGDFLLAGDLRYKYFQGWDWGGAKMFARRKTILRFCLHFKVKFSLHLREVLIVDYDKHYIPFFEDRAAGRDDELLVPADKAYQTVLRQAEIYDGFPGQGRAVRNGEIEKPCVGVVGVFELQRELDGTLERSVNPEKP